MYEMFLTTIFIFTSICFAMFQAMVGKRAVGIFNPLSLIVAACVTYLMYYFQFTNTL